MEKDAPPCLNSLTKKAPYKGLGADSEEKHEPASDINTAVVDSLKVLDPERPIREATVARPFQNRPDVPLPEVSSNHSITSSASARSLSGTTRPSALAAFKL